MGKKFKLELECMEWEDAKMLQMCLDEAAKREELHEVMRKVDELLGDGCTNLDVVLIGLEILKREYFADEIGKKVVTMCLIGVLFKEEMLKIGAVAVDQVRGEEERGKSDDLWGGLNMGGLKH